MSLDFINVLQHAHRAIQSVNHAFSSAGNAIANHFKSLNGEDAPSVSTPVSAGTYRVSYKYSYGGVADGDTRHYDVQISGSNLTIQSIITQFISDYQEFEEEGQDGAEILEIHQMSTEIYNNSDGYYIS